MKQRTHKSGFYIFKKVQSNILLSRKDVAFLKSDNTALTVVYTHHTQKTRTEKVMLQTALNFVWLLHSNSNPRAIQVNTAAGRKGTGNYEVTKNRWFILATSKCMQNS